MTETPEPRATSASTARGVYLLGILLAVGGLVIYGVQFGVLAILTVPWYAPALATIGVVLMIYAVVRRRTAMRIVGLVLVGILPAAELWYFASYSLLPEYNGPAIAGEPLPEFEIAWADGRPFDSADLSAGQPTVLTFFRGRW